MQIPIHIIDDDDLWVDLVDSILHRSLPPEHELVIHRSRTREEGLAKARELDAFSGAMLGTLLDMTLEDGSTIDDLLADVEQDAYHSPVVVLSGRQPEERQPGGETLEMRCCLAGAFRFVSKNSAEVQDLLRILVSACIRKLETRKKKQSGRIAPDV